jgi:hypothetical protein
MGRPTPVLQVEGFLLSNKIGNYGFIIGCTVFDFNRVKTDDRLEVLIAPHDLDDRLCLKVDAQQRLQEST